MTDNHQRRFGTSAEEDRISNLPENLIDSILEKLPIQDAIRTNILSKYWRYKWTTMTKLVLDKQFSDKFAKKGAFDPNGFIRITNQILNLHKGAILKLYLHIPDMILDSFQEVDQWILLLSRNGVRELILANSNQCYQLPSFVYSSLKLRKLQFQTACIFNPPLDLQGFLYLKALFFSNVIFGASLHGKLINLPELKYLKLMYCINVHHFNIQATNLETLIVITYPDATLPQLSHSQCLTYVLMYTLTSTQSVAQAERTKLVTYVRNLPNTLQFSISEKVPTWLPGVANRSRHWGFIDIKLDDLDQVQGALFMLRNLPNLERLSVLKGLPSVNLDEQPAISYLEASGCSIQTFNQLKIVEILLIEGSKPELLFIKLLLAHSPILEKMTIQLNGPADAHKSLNFAKEVMRFRRISANAEMLLLDP
uniref:F-box/FBD/LRR-repeat protein At1g13570-like n=1 Tax=Erigeron canadensis TaxID=72917 RepID=UPI001CB8E310|nr:F-box/FBD/LRR-repeat protein At1g13570-like [Erigeron canadensis]